MAADKMQTLAEAQSQENMAWLEFYDARDRLAPAIEEREAYRLAMLCSERVLEIIRGTPGENKGKRE